MDFQMTPADFIAAFRDINEVLAANRDYITGLDAATGDGDHWVNMNMGFQKILEKAENLAQQPLSEMLKQVAMLMMSTIGGSSGALYGSAFLAASKAVQGRDALDSRMLCELLDAMCSAVMTRGDSKPGYKTMVDAIFPAVEIYKSGLLADKPTPELLAEVGRAAVDGANATADMEAVRGRACYQANKGVGCIDPGAMTMSYIVNGLTGRALALCC